MPNGEKLSRFQDKAIAALLTEPTVAAAAKKAGVGERTLRGWLKRPDFAAAYHAACRGQLADAVRLLQKIAHHAVVTLGNLLRAPKDSDKARAVEIALNFAFRGTDQVDVTAEIEELKARIEELEHADSRSPAPPAGGPRSAAGPPPGDAGGHAIA
jgi:hypothetical protein